MNDMIWTVVLFVQKAFQGLAYLSMVWIVFALWLFVAFLIDVTSDAGVSYQIPMFGLLVALAAFGIAWTGVYSIAGLAEKSRLKRVMRGE